MKFIQTKLADAWLIQPEVFKDARGFFLESYSQKEFKKQGIDINFIQDNHSFSKQKGVLRGLHFQKPPFAQSKLVRVIRGRIYDVIVDLRKKSPTFKKWQGFELSSENFLMLLVPRGFAHGFITLEDNTDFVYKCDNYYHPESEAGIIWNDVNLDINWPT
ncbi:MAG TPA: dTDP-4-dehydrorhamnose 3,5-epimerase, partial [Candidatus Moranbacteria bacterium]|nr:dTDP-4-dehydrorhamnose 3,5-epimerase [Candidatus Moranbacteria bacterium]